jgi:DNA-binding Xre family transcriptional regulator
VRRMMKRGMRKRKKMTGTGVSEQSRTKLS